MALNRDGVERDGADQQPDERVIGSMSDLPRQRFSSTTIIQTRIAPRGVLSTQRIQYPRFALGGPIESVDHEVGRRSSGGPNLDMLRGAARVSDIHAHASGSRSTGLRTADGPRFRTWV